MNFITALTRRDIFDLFCVGIKEEDGKVNRISYHGVVDEIDFLMRLYNLDEILPSDEYYADFHEEYFYNNVKNNNWEYAWVFHDKRFKINEGDDKYLLNFLSTVFHPAVRDDKKNWVEFLARINKLLEADGYSCYEKEHISGRAVFYWKHNAKLNPSITYQLQSAMKFLDSKYVESRYKSIISSIDSSPSTAIGDAKELLETCCKTILKELAIGYEDDIKINKLMKLTCEKLGVHPNSVSIDHKAFATSKIILGNFSAITQGLAELRNLFGDGHGKSKDFVQLPPRYAHLAVGVSSVAVFFLIETYRDKFLN